LNSNKNLYSNNVIISIVSILFLLLIAVTLNRIIIRSYG